MSSARELLVRAGSGVFVLRLVAVALAMGVEILLTNTLGSEHYGYLAVGLSWLAILSIVGSLGMNTAVVRFLPAAIAQRRQEEAAGVIRYTGRTMLAFSVLVAALFWLGSPWLVNEGLSGTGEKAQRSVFMVVAALVPVQALNIHRQAVLQGLKHPVRALLPDQVIRLVGLAALILLAIQLRGAVGAYEASLAMGGGLLLALLFGQYWQRQVTPKEVQAAKFNTDRRELWRVALPLAWISGMHLIFVKADPAMIGWLSSSEQAGLYAAAARIANLLVFGLYAVNAIIAPLISELYSTDQEEQLQELLALAAKGILFYTLPLAIALLAIGGRVLSLFGEDFVEAYSAMRWLIVGLSVSAMAGSVGYLLTMTKHERIVARVLTICAVGKVVGNFVLIPVFEAEGAAIASAMSLVLWNLLLYLEVKKRTRYEPSVLAIFKSGYHPS